MRVTAVRARRARADIFCRLTGRYATVSNYPGTTVTITSGRAMIGAEVCDVVDTPGVNALQGVLSEDERITREMLTGTGAELIVQVADAVIERDSSDPFHICLQGGLDCSRFFDL